MNLTTWKSIADCYRPGRHSTPERGLYLEVQERAGRITRSWLFRWSRDGRTRYRGLGSFESASWSRARGLAVIARAALEQGYVPVMSPAVDARPHVITFRQLAEKFMAHASETKAWKPGSRTADSWRGSLEAHAYPAIGELPCDQIKKSHCYELLKPLWSTMRPTGERVRHRIERVLAFGSSLDLYPPNHAAQWKGGLDGLLIGKKGPTRHRAAVGRADARALYATIAAAPDGLRARAPGLFVALTVVRTAEALGARWCEIDRAKACWNIPAERMKASPNGHTVPLSRAALELLDEVQNYTRCNGGHLQPDAFVFLTARGKRLNHSILQQAMRQVEPLATVHGWRSTFKDWATSKSLDRLHVEHCLAHKFGDQVETAYQRDTFVEERRTIMEAWAAHLTGEQAKVITLGRRRRVVL